MNKEEKQSYHSEDIQNMIFYTELYLNKEMPKHGQQFVQVWRNLIPAANITTTVNKQESKPNVCGLVI